MAGNEVSRPIHVLFNGDNFFQWYQAISSYLKGRKLWRYVSGVRTIPVKEEKESDATYDLRLEEWCHAPNPGPTRLADPNRFPGRETQDWDSLPDFFFFLKAELIPVGMAHI